MEGWLYLHRKILDWEWYGETNTFRIFLHLLLTANFKPKKWQGIEILRGQTIISREKLAKTLRISPQTIRTCLTRLKSTREITIKSTNRFSIITLINYEKYQKMKNYQPANQPTNQQTINQQSTSNQPHYNKDNKEKNEKELIISASQSDANNMNNQFNQPSASFPELNSPPQTPPLTEQPETTTALAVDQNEAIVEVFDIFRTTNGAVVSNKMYANKTQRKAITDLFDMYGVPLVLKAAKYAVSVQTDTYAPVITTPYMLKNKFTQLLIHFERQKKKGGKLIIGTDFSKKN